MKCVYSSLSGNNEGEKNILKVVFFYVRLLDKISTHVINTTDEECKNVPHDSLLKTHLMHKFLILIWD